MTVPLWMMGGESKPASLQSVLRSAENVSRVYIGINVLDRLRRGGLQWCG